MIIEKEIASLKSRADRYEWLDMPTNATECRLLAGWLEELLKLQADCAHYIYMYGKKGVSM